MHKRCGIRLAGAWTVLVPALALLVACQDGASPPGTPSGDAIRLTIVPAELELATGASQTVQVQVTNKAGAPVALPPITWSSTNPSVASVAGGNITAITVGTANIIASGGGAADTAIVRVVPVPPASAAIEVFPDVTYQTMTGWEGTAQIGEAECNPQSFALYRQEVLDRLVNELGINRVRIHVRSGHENPVDYYTTFRNSHIVSDWNPHRYESVNDNNDPRVANLAGFQFAELDHKVEVIIEPMRAALQARGERLYVNLNYVDFGVSPWEQSSDPEEYAELLLVTFLHFQERYGWVPDAVEVSLEPDNTPNWRPQVIGRALVAAGDRLKAAGFRPDFITPSTASMAGALTFLNEMLAVPRVLEYLDEVAYHRYNSVSAETLRAIGSRALELGLRTGMLEHIGSGYQDLHQDLRDGRNSSWQQFVLAFCASTDNGGRYYQIDQTVPTAPRVVMGSRTRYLRQYFPFIRFNAQRVSAVSGDSRLDPLAFRNANGKLVVVVAATSAAPVQVGRLPSGTYGVTYTTATQTFVSLPDVVVGASGVLQTSMPAAGVITIHAR